MARQRRHFSTKQKREILREVDEMGLSVTLRKHGLYGKAISAWRKQIAEEDASSEVPEIVTEKQLNRRLLHQFQQLKEIVADKELEIRVLRDALKKVPIARRTHDDRSGIH